MDTDRLVANALAHGEFHSESSVRDLRAGEYFTLTGHPEVDRHPHEERDFVITALQGNAQNNLPRRWPNVWNCCSRVVAGRRVRRSRRCKKKDYGGFKKAIDQAMKYGGFDDDYSIHTAR